MKTPIESMRDIAAQVAALGGPGRGGGTRKLAEARARVSGKSVAAELRAVQRSLKSGKPPAKQSPTVAEAGAAKALAAKIRAARQVVVGDIRVTYTPPKGRPRSEGFRGLGTYSMTGTLAAAMADAADKLDKGDTEEAQQMINDALLAEYGVGGGTLDIADFVDGLIFK